MQLANYYLERDEYAQATQILGTAVERSRRQSEELLYYLADARYRQGDEVAASKLLGEIEELDPTSFYLQPQVDPRFKQPLIGSNGHVILEGDDGLLEFLKRAFEIRERSYQNIRATLDVMSEPNANVQASALYLERGRQFLQMGFRDWAELELRVLESDYDLSPRYWFELGVLYDDFAMHWRSVRAFQRVYYSASGETRDSLSFDFQFLMHPVPFPAQVFENCMRNGIPPHLVYAMMRQESRYDQNAVSSAGAVGLMQLMPSTGQHVAGKLGYPDGSDEQLFVPEVNLTFGIWYASHLLARTSGDPLMMLAAYNAGLGNARRWFRDGGNEQSRAIISMVDGIDYGETKDYVKRIVESATIYHALYFDTDPSSGNGFH